MLALNCIEATRTMRIIAKQGNQEKPLPGVQRRQGSWFCWSVGARATDARFWCCVARSVLLLVTIRRATPPQAAARCRYAPVLVRLRALASGSGAIQAKYPMVQFCTRLRSALCCRDAIPVPSVNQKSVRPDAKTAPTMCVASRVPLPAVAICTSAARGFVSQRPASL